MKKVLIAGATGLIGTTLTKLLRENNYEIAVLSTRKNAKVAGAEVFQWAPYDFFMEEKALENVSAIINLAGANINKKWTPEYKQEIYDSRTRTAETLFKYVAKQKNNQIKSYLSSSGMGIYPSSLSATFVETDLPDSRFLGRVCQAWEAAADPFEKLGARVVKFRTGMVLSRDGGALPLLEKITKFGIASPIGSGKQWVSWIHEADVCRMMLYALENENVSGPINTTAPHPVTNTELTKTLAKQLGQPAHFPNVPTFALKLILGQRSVLATDSQRASTEKITSLGFTFKFPTLDQALTDLFAQ